MENIDINTIKIALKGILPGENAQMELFQKGRKKRSDLLRINGDFRESAVALILFHQDKQLFSLLIQRPEYNGFHSGQMALPGGKWENDDTNLIATARRESQEEVGLDASAFELLGKLSPLLIPVSKFKVHPFVFFYPKIPHFIREEREVAKIITYPIDMVLKENVILYKKMEVKKGIVLKDVPYFDIKGNVVWGATAIILNEFRRLFI